MECRQVSHKKKIQQLENSFDVFAVMLKREGYKAYANKISFNNDQAIKDYINQKIDVVKYFDIEWGEGIECLRVSCNNAFGANFFKHNKTTLYKCHISCNCENDTISLFELIYETFKQQYRITDYNAIMYHIKLMFCQDYESDFYKEFREIVEHNRAVIQNLHHRKYLARLFKRRNLMDFYQYFTELALIYMKEDEEIPYSFYCSNSVIKRTFKYVFETSASNYQIDKVNLLVALGLVEKLDEDSCSKRMREKIIKAKIIASKGKPFMLKATSAYRMKKLSPADIEEAERRAKIILENKIYSIKQDTFKEIETQNKREIQRNETFIKRAKKVIKEELKNKGYIQIHKIVSKIDPKYKYYKSKKEKEELLDTNIKRIISDYKLEIVLVNNSAREHFKLTKSVKDDTEILIRKNVEFLNKKKSSKNDDVFVENTEVINNVTVTYQMEDIDTSVAPF